MSSYPVEVIGELSSRYERAKTIACACQEVAEKAAPIVQAAKTIGDLVVWPSDVDAAIIALDARYESQHQDMVTCLQSGKLPQSTGSAWVNDYQGWKQWAGTNMSSRLTSLLLTNPATLPAVLVQAQDRMAHVQAYQSTLADWNTKTTQAGCVLSSPQQQKPANPAQPLDVTSVVKWSAAALIALAIAYAIHKAT